ncbi:superfamily II DNA/RNA helicase [Motilibacter rhizosphaerae]|uniref:Superfamily II DNA/RNA helicase n=2 Tax=Motilibacter rhizosphaerae TaxID=598652 RepID=A0A4Q7NSR7_9ACTN|nr:superfamily II DNA/RNA helicase [Motilibacter rhizosphaerae]
MPPRQHAPRPSGRGSGPRPTGGRPVPAARTAPTGQRAPRPAAPQPGAQPAAQPAVAELPTRTFAELGVPAALAAELVRQGKTTAFPIQTATLPDSLAGRDVLGRGATGSGKTLAFALPLVARLSGAPRSRPSTPRGLVLVPTRELANQVADTVAPLATAAGLRTTTIFGGVPQGRQERALQAGADIVIACPGRLEDLVRQGLCDLGSVAVTVLDEADHMADLGFLPGVKRLLDKTPARGQRLLFSATLDNGVDVLVQRYLTDPKLHAVAPPVAPVQTMEHHVLEVVEEDKGAVVRELASGLGRRVLFTRTKHQAKKLAKQLTAAGVPAVDLHGNLSQNARERNLQAFSEGGVRVLVATDIAARGIHVDEVELVVHVDPPAEHKAYLHRSGRTARAGASGAVVTVMTPDQRRDVQLLSRQAKITPAQHRVRPGDQVLAGLVGEHAPLVVPQPEPVVQPSAPRPPRAGAGRPRRGGPRRG